jgi:hypothetical protein
MLLIVLVGAFVLAPPRRRFLFLLGPALATLAPLLYGLALTHDDPSWHFFQQQTIHGFGSATSPWWALLASFGPLVAFALLGLRRSLELKWILLYLWMVACVLVYFVVPEFPPHALTGITVPLGVLAARGFDRAARWSRVPSVVSVAVALVLLALAIVPGAIYQVNGATGYTRTGAVAALDRQLLILTDKQHDAMRFLARDPTPGGVLAPYVLSLTVPGQSGRAVYAGHQQWPQASYATATDAFYSPQLRDPTGALRRAALRRSRATFVIDPCGSPAAIARALAPVTTVVGRFGCLTVRQTR